MSFTWIVTKPEGKGNWERMRAPDRVPRQRSTRAKGLVIITKGDEDRLTNVIVKPDVYWRYYGVLRNCFLLIVEGIIQKQGGILNALAEGGRDAASAPSSPACRQRTPATRNHQAPRQRPPPRWPAMGPLKDPAVLPGGHPQTSSKVAPPLHTRAACT